MTTVMPFDTILSALKDKASTTAMFADVLLHEPKSAPISDSRSRQAVLAIWVGKFGAFQKQSGLASTALQMTVMARVYRTAMADPEDEIDRDILNCTSAIMEAITGGFTLGSLVMAVDLDGSTGTPMTATLGYLTQDSMIFRVADITIPIILTQEWSQVP